MQARSRTTLPLALALSLGMGNLAACGGDDTSDLPPPLTAARDATTEECAFGGRVIETGVDANENGTLDDEEVANTQAVCNPDPGDPGDPGEDGLDALVRSTAEPAGANCADGGVRIDSGLDDDRDGQLGDEEIDNTTFVCNQPSGEDGASFLVRTSAATAEQCENGGVVLESGLDDDNSGELDDPEVEFTRVICAGADGSDRLVEVEIEPPGSNCSAGGQRIREGLDANGDGTLQAPEIEQVVFVCRPVASLVVTSTVGSGADCPNGGLRIERGLDVNANDVLEPSEVVETSFACDGGDGQATLVRTSTIGAGADCANGGTRIETGVDDDGDGVLAASEVDTVSFACDGDSGLDGRGNSAVNITREPAGANCPNGGTRIETGPDTNGDGALDPSEVTNTTYACDEPDATQNLVTVTQIPPGATCIDGGQRIESGLDDNGDGTLQPTEVDNTQVLCSAVPVVPVGITTPSNLGTVFAADDLSSITIDGVGGLGGGYTWSIQNPPPGVGINPTGTPSTNLTGSSTVTGTFTFGVIITDASGAVASQTFTLTISNPPCGPGLNGAVGATLTNITVPSTFSFSVRGMASDNDPNGWVYFVEPGLGFNRFRKDGSAKEDDLQNNITGLANGDIGYEMDIDGNNIYLTNDSTSCTSLCVYRISNDGGQTFAVQDLADFSTIGAPNDDLRGIHVAGNTMYVITHDSADTQLYSIDLSGALPATPTLLATFPDLEYCSGLDGDSRYLYTVCDEVDTNFNEGVARIDLTTNLAEAVLLTPTFFTVGTDIISGVYGQDLDGDNLFDIMYVSGDGGDDLYLCAPSAPTLGAVFNREWLFGFTGDDEGLAFDRANNALYKVDEGGAAAARFQ